ncbi:uncharacterized protein LOC114354809 [Ostrinia furnacalis]|uniref:uncharacterized protein LOC114354809 n=1 Tax=Ostrinia furnacalis TaxID=93504 RepID=UPI00103ACE14|nr:uncharacterized protein LOC114354809 [Ostrinia furnacalis]
MIHLEGFTVCAAGEVKSREHAFKVYHTGTAFYFACDSRDSMLAWIHLIHRATLNSGPPQSDISKQFSETDYSDTESDTDGPERRERERREDKDKSKFGSLRKLAGRRSDSHESVGHASTSLDRKYLRFFSRNKTKDDTKNGKSKHSGVPVPTEHYRSYRRVEAAGRSPAAGAPPATGAPPAAGAPGAPPAAAKIPKPINYIHASNPNLLDFEKSDFVTKPTLRVPRPRAKPEPSPMGLVTLEEFMLNKQAEERKQVYTNRVLLGVERDRPADLQLRLDRIVPDVIYGELRACAHMQGRSLPRAPAGGGAEPARQPRDAVKPISVKGKDGYEKLVYPSEAAALGYESIDEPAPPERWRDSLRRNDKVHSAPRRAGAAPLVHASPLPADSWSGSGSGGGGAEGSRLRLVLRHARQSPPTSRAEPAARAGAGAWGVYPHLQCPPTFQPESYSLARLAPPPPAPAPSEQ